MTRPPLPTSAHVLELAKVLDAYYQLTDALSGLDVRYAVKANNHPAVLRALVGAGSGLDVASSEEIALALKAGCPGERMSYGQPIRDDDQVAYGISAGVGAWTVDSDDELDRMARMAPGARILIRLHHDGAHAKLPLAAKFGTTPAQALALAIRANAQGLRVIGLAWHVGSQQTDPGAYDRALAVAAKVWSRCTDAGLRDLQVLNLGGGLPGTYRDPAPALHTYTDTIHASLHRHFGPTPPQTWMEPGRGLVADAADLHTRVKAVVHRPDGHTWLTTDALVWNAGLVETLIDAGIEYRVTAPDFGPGAELRDMIISGPTCDSADSLKSSTPYRLPAAIRPGAKLILHSTGAYCATSSTKDFNGYPPVETVIV